MMSFITKYPKHNIVEFLYRTFNNKKVIKKSYSKYDLLDIINLTKNTIGKRIKDLIKENYIVENGFEGRRKLYKINESGDFSVILAPYISSNKLKKIEKNIKKNYKKIEDIKEDIIKKENDNLKKENDNLKKENQNLKELVEKLQKELKKDETFKKIEDINIEIIKEKEEEKEEEELIENIKEHIEYMNNYDNSNIGPPLEEIYIDISEDDCEEYESEEEEEEEVKINPKLQKLYDKIKDAKIKINFHKKDTNKTKFNYYKKQLEIYENRL